MGQVRLSKKKPFAAIVFLPLGQGQCDQMGRLFDQN